MLNFLGVQFEKYPSPGKKMQHFNKIQKWLLVLNVEEGWRGARNVVNWLLLSAPARSIFRHLPIIINFLKSYLSIKFLFKTCFINGDYFTNLPPLKDICWNKFYLVHPPLIPCGTYRISKVDFLNPPPLLAHSWRLGKTRWAPLRQLLATATRKDLSA